MAIDPVAARYAKAAFDAAKADDAVDDTLEQLKLIGRLIDESPDLCNLLLDPDIEALDKVNMINRALKGSLSALVMALLHVVVSMGRADSFSSIIESYNEAVDSDQGRTPVVIRSAYKLSDEQLIRVKERLEHSEKKKVMLKAEIAPELIGGIQIVIGHRLIDGSIRRGLDDLKEQLQSAKVY